MTFLPDSDLPARGAVALYDASTADGPPSALGRAAERLDLPAAAPGRVTLARPRGGRPQVEALEALLLPLGQALPWLLGGAAAARGGIQRAPDSLRVWCAAARLGTGLAAAHRMAPTLVRARDGQVHGVWRALVDDDPDAHAAMARLAAAMPPAGHAVALDDRTVWAPEALLAAFLDAVADLAVRRGGPGTGSGRPRARLLPWTARWAEALADPTDPTVPLRDDADELVAGAAAWHAAAGRDASGGVATELRLRTPERHGGAWPLEFGVRTEDGAYLPATAVWRADPADGRAGDAAPAAALQEALLHGLGRCARAFPPVAAALRDAAPERLDLDVEQAWELITEAGPLLVGAGVIVVLPEGLAEDTLRLRLRLGVDERGGAVEEGGAPGGEGGAPAGEGGGDRRPDGQLAAAQLPGVRGSGEGGGGGPFDGLLTAFRWELAVGDEALTREEFAELVAAKAPLVRWRGRWVRVDPDRAERLAGLLHGPGGLGEGELPLAEAVLLGLAGSHPQPAGPESDEEGPDDDPALAPAEVVADAGLADLLERLRRVTDQPPVPATPDGFAGQLRGYQRRGVAWLQAMGRLGLGAVLADDMGLGKTVQLIAHVLGRVGGDGRAAPAHLIVCPTSVVGNWERELARFAPGLAVTRHHGPDRAARLDEVRGAVVTTYGTLRRDVDMLAAVDWDVVALDEAQHVKNSDTAAARAARRLRRRQTVAMTGTPLENRLAELWALMDLTNPGLLGSRAGFARRYATPVERRGDPAAAARLRRLVAPFVLRRAKSDPGIIGDLPEKIERSVVCPLTPEQAALYQAAVDRVLGDELAGADAMQRRGRILALLTELKQICNHPVQYLQQRPAATAGPPGDRSALAGRSGKLAAAREIVAEAVEAGDRVLVFTQYVAMGRLLVSQLSADLGVEVAFLHGGVPAAARDRLVGAFQDDDDTSPVLVVSLRAGGTGLNLTAATHVVHYDRWWNPAVEDQATDRAHRIGQTRTVEVHKLVTAGTVEERIAELLESKRGLADAVVAGGETWITELDDRELAELVALSADASVSELDDDLEGPQPRNGARSLQTVGS